MIIFFICLGLIIGVGSTGYIIWFKCEACWRPAVDPNTWYCPKCDPDRNSLE